MTKRFLIGAGLAVIGLSGCTESRDESVSVAPAPVAPSDYRSPVVDRDLNADAGRSTTGNPATDISSGVYIGKQPKYSPSPDKSSASTEKITNSERARRDDYSQSGDYGYFGIPPSTSGANPYRAYSGNGSGILDNPPIIVTTPSGSGQTSTSYPITGSSGSNGGFYRADQ